MVEIHPNSKPKWLEFRKWVARVLVRMARKIEPESHDVWAHFSEQIFKAQVDMLNYGKGSIKIEHVPFDPFEEQNKEAP